MVIFYTWKSRKVNQGLWMIHFFRMCSKICMQLGNGPKLGEMVKICLRHGFICHGNFLKDRRDVLIIYCLWLTLDLLLCQKYHLRWKPVPFCRTWRRILQHYLITYQPSRRWTPLRSWEHLFPDAIIVCQSQSYWTTTMIQSVKNWWRLPSPWNSIADLI